jgi:hypothetical protein
MKLEHGGIILQGAARKPAPLGGEPNPGISILPRQSRFQILFEEVSDYVAENQAGNIPLRISGGSDPFGCRH